MSILAAKLADYDARINRCIAAGEHLRALELRRELGDYVFDHPLIYKLVYVGDHMADPSAEIARLRADVARLEQLVCDFQAASMLERGGDPGGITPSDVEREVTRLRADVERLRETIEETLPELRHHVETAKPFTRRRLMELISVCTAALADTADKPNEGG